MTASCASTSGRHDRATDYTNHACRCPAARADRERRRKRGHLDGPMRVPATGARRRLRALMRIGWSQNDLNERLGRSRSGSLGPLLWTDRAAVHVDVDQRIRAVYEELWRTRGPSKVTAIRAEARGWPPPLFWDDDLIDDPSYDGIGEFMQDLAYSRNSPAPQVLARQEDLPQIADLSAKGLSGKEIAGRLGCSTRRVTRLRAVLRAAESSDTTGTVDDMQRAAS